MYSLKGFSSSLKISNNFDLQKSGNIISYIESKCPRSASKFFTLWLKARAKIFEHNIALINEKNNQEEILVNYKKAFDCGIAYAGWFLPQFLIEGIVINRYFNPRRDKDVNDFFGYGYVLEVFGDNKQKLLEWLKKERRSDIRYDFIRIYHEFNPSITYALINEKDLQRGLSETKEGKQLEIEKANNLIQKCTLHSFQLNQLIDQPELGTLFNNATNWNNKGLEYKKTSLFLEAELCFSQAIAMKPHYVNAYTNRGQAFAECQKSKNRTNGILLDLAFSDFNIALLLEPMNEIALFNRAKLFQRTKQYEKAITDLTQLIEIKPEDFGAYTMIGSCYLCMKNIYKAEEYNKKAIMINPNSAEGHWNLGSVYKASGDLKKAMYHI